MPAGSLADQVEGLQGVTCTFMNLSTGETIQVAAARLDSEGVSVIKTQIAAMNPFDITLEGDWSWEDGFSRSSENGVSMFVVGDVWLVASSSTFLTSADPMDFLSVVLPGL